MDNEELRMAIEELIPGMAESLLKANQFLGEVIDVLLEGKITLEAVQTLGAVTNALPEVHRMMVTTYSAQEIINRALEVLNKNPETETPNV